MSERPGTAEQTRSESLLTFETVRLPGDGLTLAADVIGAPFAPPVFFFHGGGQSRRSWRGAARRVAEAGYRGFTIDLRGHGESDWASDGDYLLDAYARDVEQILRTAEGPVTLVGASRGGQAALVGGSRHQDRVSLIMLADVSPLIAETGVDRIRRFLTKSIGGFTSVGDAADALSSLLEQPRVNDPAGLRKMMREDSSGRLFWKWDPRTVSPEFLNPPSEGLAVEAAASRLSTPIVLVRAEHSDVVTEASVGRFRELTSQLLVVEAPGVGHMFTGDHNDKFADSLLSYLARFAPLA